MDVLDFINRNGQRTVPNPNYNPKSKKNTEPSTIIVPDVQPITDDVIEMAKRDALNQFSIDSNISDKYRKYGLNYNPSEDFDLLLAKHQSGLEQARNSLIQTISEATLGTAKAFADLFDLVTLAQMRKDSDYQNPISTQLEEWQKKIKEDVAPIYQDPNVSILNGGLFDSGFIFGGLPSVVSSLTLLIPSKAVSYGLTRGVSWITKKGLTFARNMERAHKAAQLGDAAEGASRVAKVNAYINGPASQTVKNVIDYGIGGLTSRLLENYQEGRQTFDESKPVYTQIINNMSLADRNKTVNKLKEEFGEDAADWGSNEDVANLVARKAADETFKEDMVNVFSDIYQMYAIGKVGRAINGPSRSALNRLNKMNIKTAGMSKEAVDKLLASRTGWQKFRDKATDVLFGGRDAVLSELSEGVEEAVNYIAQEEGFHYGKVLLDQEAQGDFFSDRLTDYMVSPKLWDSAFWGLAGGVIFNKTGEYANRTTQAFDKIRKAKQLKEASVDEANNIKVPTFREAFRDTELAVRKANLEDNVQNYRQTEEKLARIQAGEDVYHITMNGKLESQEEKDAAKEMAIREFRDGLLLDAMDNGNYDLTKEYLSSNELKQALVTNGHLTQEQADRIQSEVLSRGDELLQVYNKNLRRLYNAVADWGENNDADLTQMPAEIFNIIARENISHELAAKYYGDRIARLQEANAILENDSREELDKAARENGVTDFKSIVEQVYKAQQLGIINAEIADLKDKKQHLTASGQAMLRTLEANKRLIQEDIANSSTGATDVDTAVNLLMSSQAASAVELLPFEKGSQHTYQVNEGNVNYTALAEAVNKRDRKILSALSPSMERILNNNPSTETDRDTFLDEVINAANTRDQIIRNLYDNKGNLKLLKNINEQLDANYKEMAALQINAMFENSRINTTKSQITSRAHDILNQLKDGKGFFIGTRAQTLETASHLYQQLAKKYGKEELKIELNNYVRLGRHTPVFEQFNDDEQSTFESVTALVKFNRPENDVALGDIYRALNENDIYEYTKEQDVVELIKEERRKRQEAATQNSSTNQNSNSAGQNQRSNNQSGQSAESNRGQGNGQNGGVSVTEVPLEEEEIGDGTVIPNDDETPDNTTDNTTGGATGSASASSTGEGAPTVNNSAAQTLDTATVVSAVRARVNELAESNPEGITRETLIQQTKDAISSAFTDVEESDINDLVDTAIDIVDRRLAHEGESIESALAKNVIRLSRVAINSRSEQAIKEAKSILNQTFDELLDNFNRHLSKGKVDGKYIIPLEALIRYARSITNNEFEAQEMYDAFTKIIAEHPEKYATIQGKPISQNKVIENITTPVEKRMTSLDSSLGGRTFNFAATLASLSKEDRAKVEQAIKSLRPGDKIYVEANYENEKLMDHKDDMFIGGIDFVVIDGEGNKIKIASAPTAMKLGDGYGEMEDGWFYRFPYANELGKKEYPIQTFFKNLLISDAENAKKFRDLLRQYEALNAEEAYGEIGENLLDEAYEALKAFAKDDAKVNLNNFTQRSSRSKEDDRNRVRHLAKLDVYTQDKWSLDVEDLNYETDEEDVDLMNDSFRKSIDNWFNKMVESSNARHEIENALDKLGKGVYNVGVEVESVGKPVLVVTREDKALPVSEAIAEQHKDQIHLAAGNLANTSQVVVSGGQPMSLGGSNTTGRSVVIIDTPDGSKTYINAYPIQVNNSIFESNTKLNAFKEAIELRLDELMDDWYRTRNSEELEAFLDSLGHKSNETRKIGGSLFAGFTRTPLKNGNGFSITYKTKKDISGKDVIIPPGSREDGETHYLTFYDTVPTKNGKKARAAVQDYVRGRATNTTVVWNTSTGSAELALMKKKVREVLIDSLKVRIDPLNINADNDSKMSYGSFMTRDVEGNFALRVSGIKKPNSRLAAYAQPNGDIVITGLGRNGNPGTFSDFILFNDMVNLTTRPIGGSNFSIFDNSDGDYGITYRINRGTTSSPVEKVTVAPVVDKLSKVVKDILTSKNKNKQNDSKAVINAILNRIADANSSLYNLTKNSKIVNMLLHKNVIFVENLNGATYVMSNGDEVVIPDDAYAAYVPDNAELKVRDKTIKLEKGQIVVGDKFINLLDGNTGDMIDALHHILHENIHGFIADNDSANPELNERYKKELDALWDEYTRKYPTSVFSKNNPVLDLEEFLVESLTNIDLIRELNDTTADEPLNNPKKPKSLLGKLFDKLINWLADILGSNFKVNKDSLFAKEYAIFEETLTNTPQQEQKKEIKKVRQPKKQDAGTSAPTVTEGTLEFKEDEPGEETVSTPEIVDFKLDTTGATTRNTTSNTEVQQDNRRTAPKRRSRGPKASVIGISGASRLDKAEESTIRMDNLIIANDMEKAGKNALSIKRATGWERGADNKWRYEIEDFRLSNKLRNIINDNSWYYEYHKELILRDIVYSKDLHVIEKLYPELLDYNVKLTKDPNNGRAASISIDNKTIRLCVAYDDYIIRDAFVHEIQHFIQNAEGFAKGGSPTYFMFKRNDEFKTELELKNRITIEKNKPIVKQIEKLFDEYKNQINNIIDRLETYDNSYSISEFYDLRLYPKTEKQKELAEKIRKLQKQLLPVRKYHFDDKISSADKENYLKLAGETEARTVSKRRKMSLEERRNSLFTDTMYQDVAKEDLIFLEDNIESALSLSEETSPMTFPTLRGALDNLDGDTYFDVQEKINNGVISIKCN